MKNGKSGSLAPFARIDVAIVPNRAKTEWWIVAILTRADGARKIVGKAGRSETEAFATREEAERDFEEVAAEFRADFGPRAVSVH
jgi:hypothetical protein